jgi:hypothetical protein
MQVTQTILETILNPATEDAQVFRGVVVAVADDGTIATTGRLGGEPLRCALLHTGEPNRLELAPGDTVLVWSAGLDDSHGVVLGRIGPGRALFVEPPVCVVPETLVIEAREQLTLKCGEGSITLRGDGKVLIQGKDLVSRAQRTNRIKGGSVAIN